MNRKLIFGEDMTPEIAQSRATPNLKQTKRKKESESPGLSSRQKRRFTVSGEECQTPQKSPQAGVCYTPPMCALKKLMNSRGRSMSCSTPSTKKRYVRRANRFNTDGLRPGQRNIAEMMNAQINGGKKKSANSQRGSAD